MVTSSKLGQAVAGVLFLFVLAGDQDLEQIKNCCVEQLKGGVLTTIDSIVREIDTLTLDREASFFNIDNLEGKGIIIYDAWLNAHA